MRNSTYCFASVIAAIGILGLASAPAVWAGPGVGSSLEGPVKWVNTGSKKPFFIDVNADLSFNLSDDAKFQIQGGTPDGLMIVGDFSGNSQSQVGIITDSKVFIESGNFGWTPANDTGDTSVFFAANTGATSQVGTCDFKVDNTDDFFKVTATNKIFVDAGGDRKFNTGDGDKKFNIQGSLAGIYFAGDFGSGCQIGVMTVSKAHIESGNFSWTPANDTGDTSTFFAPNTGTVVAVLVGDFNPARTGDEIAKLVNNGGVLTFFIDMSGDFSFKTADGDQKLKIQGGSLTGPVLTGKFNVGLDADLLAQLTDKKIFVDLNGDYSWTPASGDSASFFAANVGTIIGAGAGSFAEAP